MKNSLNKILIILAILIGVIIVYKGVILIFFPAKDSMIDYSLKNKKVKLYFVNEDGYLEIEEREILGGATELDDAKICIKELITGPQNKNLVSAVPPGTVLREIYLNDDKCAYVDFDRSLIDKHTGGTEGEVFTIYSIVNTLTSNFNQITSVKILVEGQEVRTIAGHIDIRGALKEKQK